MNFLRKLKYLSVSGLILSQSLYGAGLDGKWITPCAVPEPTVPMSQRTSLTFENGQFNYVLMNYSDLNCSNGVNRLSTVGVYSEGSVFDDKVELDIEVKDLYITYLVPSQVASANLINFCGINDWALGVERSITGCEMLLPQTFAPDYGAYQIKDGKLRFAYGDTDQDNGKTPQTRSTIIDPDFFLIPVP